MCPVCIPPRIPPAVAGSVSAALKIVAAPRIVGNSRRCIAFSPLDVHRGAHSSQSPRCNSVEVIADATHILNALRFAFGYVLLSLGSYSPLRIDAIAVVRFAKSRDALGHRDRIGTSFTIPISGIITDLFARPHAFADTSGEESDDREGAKRGVA